MATPDIFNNEVHFRAGAVFGGSGVTFPAGSVTNASVAASAAIAASKLVHQRALHYRQPTGTAVVAETAYDWHIMHGSGTLVSLEAAITGAIATGADRTVTIDLHKSTGGGAFASVLSSALVLDNTNVLRVAEAAAGFSSSALADGDLLRLVVSVAGAAGNQGQGLIATLNWEENPN